MALNIKTIVVLFLSASFLILGTTVLFEKYTDAASDSLITSRHTVIIDAGHAEHS